MVPCMYKEFGENGSLVNAAVESLVFIFIVLMMVLVIAVSSSEGEFGMAVFFFISAVLISLIGLDKIKRGYKEYPLVVTDHHIICSYPYGNRKVLNRDRITWIKIIKRRVIMLHDGWPTVVHVHGLSKDGRKALEKLIVSGSS